MLRLLVTDPELLDTMERARWFLHPARYTILRARTAGEAVNQARRARPDLLVATFSQAEGAGMALVRQVRSVPGCSEVPVVLTADQATAFGQQFRQKAAAAGVQALLPRPITREDFFGTVRRVALPAGAATVRVPVAVPATLATTAGSIAGQAVNLSRGGIFVAVPQPLTPGARVRVGLTLPRFTNPITLPGQVKWANGPAAGATRSAAPGDDRLPPGVGVQFTEVPQLAQSTLNLFILSSPRAVQL